MADYILYAVMGNAIVANALRDKCDVWLTVCERWQEAEEAIRAELPSLLIMSYLQLDAEGPKVIELLRNNPETQTMPIVLITQRSPSNTVEQAMRNFESENVIAKFHGFEDIGKLIELVRAYS